MTEQEILSRLSGDDLSIFEQSVKRLIDNMIAEIAEFRAALAEGSAPITDGWISVKDRLPDEDRIYLTIDTAGEYDIMYGFAIAQATHYITHYTTLPSPPAAQGKE